MQEIKQEKLYQAGKVDQGFNPFKAADVTPYLRENQQTEQAQMRAIQDQQLRDVKLSNQSEKLALKTAQQEQNLKQYVAKIEDLQESRDMQQLSQFSNKLFDVVHQVREQRYKDRQAEIQVLFSEDEAARQEAELIQKANEDQLSVLAAGDMALAQEAAKNNEPYTYVQRMRSLSGEDRYLYATAHAANVGETFKSFAATQLRENTGFITLNDGRTRIQINQPQDEAEASAVIAHLLKEHIKNNDAENLPPGLTSTYIYKQTDKARASLLADWSKDNARNKSFVDNELSFESLKARYKGNEQAVQEYLNRVSLNWNDAGTRRLGYPGAHEKLFDELLTLSTGTSEERFVADQLVKQYSETTLNGQPFGVIQKDRIDKLKALVAAHDAKARKDQLNATKAQLDDVMMKQREALGNEFTQSQLGSVIRFGHQAYGAEGLFFDEGPWRKLWGQASLGGQELDEIRTNLRNKFFQGKVSEEDWDRLPDAIKMEPEFSKRWVAQQKVLHAKHNTKREAIETTVMGDEYVNTASRSARAIGHVIVQDLQREFDRRLADVLGNPDHPLNGDEEAAAQKILDDLIGTFKDGVTTKGGRYYHNRTRGFENYLNYGLDEKAVTNQFRQRQDTVVQLAQNVGGQRASESPELIGTEEQVRGWVKDIETGKPPNAGVQRFAQLLGMPYVELINNQSIAQGDGPVEEYIPFIEYMKKQEDPVVTRQLTALQNGYFSQVQQQRLRGQRTVRPAYNGLIASTPPRSRLINAFEGKESTWNPTAVNDRTGATGLIQVLPENIPSWTQRYLGVRMTPAEYRANPGAQRQLAVKYFDELVETHTVPGRSEEEIIRRVAAEHYGGRPDQWDNPEFHSRNGPYNPGDEPNMQEYTLDIWNRYQGGM